MAWNLSGRYVEACNCDYLCPCGPSGLSKSTNGTCTFVMGFDVEKGAYDGTPLAGRRLILLLRTDHIFVCDGNFGLSGWVVWPMTSDDECGSWAAETFSAVDLGDLRRTRRLVNVAASLARSTSGTVMGAMSSPAEREGAFRFLANERFDVEDLSEGIARSTLARCSGLTYCPVDGSSISLSDGVHARDVGAVGTWASGGRGLQAITTLAADARGVPVGILSPQWWVRTERSPHRTHKPHRSMRTEMRHVLTALARIEKVREEQCSSALLWFQLDRGFDAWSVFHLAEKLDLLITVRSSSDRRIETASGVSLLYPTLAREPQLGTLVVQVPEREGRPRRAATLSVRVARVQLLLQVGRKRQDVAPVSAVCAEEINYSGTDRLRWVLLTTAKITDFAGASAVIRGYTTRWLIEDLHRAWKRGWTNVEQTQLRRRNSIAKWATLHLALASRALRLARLARSEPQEPATAELSRDEIDAVLLLKKEATRHRVGETPPLRDVVLLLAEIGGYDRYSKKPPGPTVIGRGLERIASLAEGLGRLRGEK